MLEIIPEHKLQRNGGWINAVPKWQELIKEWDLDLEEFPVIPCDPSPRFTPCPRDRSRSLRAKGSTNGSRKTKTAQIQL